MLDFLENRIEKENPRLLHYFRKLCDEMTAKGAGR